MKSSQGLSRHKISQLMDAETWMNAKEAVKLGFADEILFSGTQDKAPDDDGTGMLFFTQGGDGFAAFKADPETHRETQEHS